MNQTRRSFNQSLLAVAAVVALAKAPTQAGSPFCPTCSPEFLPKIDKGRAGHYSVDFGDCWRVQEVILDGEDVTTSCRALIEGKEGLVDSYPRDKNDRLILCSSCGKNAMRQIRLGRVSVVLKGKYERTP